MAVFRCSACNSVYQDYYPPDDTCIKCHTGTIHIITDTNTSSTTQKEEDQ